MRNSDPLTVGDIEPLEAQFYDGMPTVWKEFALSFFECIVRKNLKGLNPLEAAKLSIDLVESFAAEFGGSAPYVPTGKNISAKQLYPQIQAEFKGNNHRQLSVKFNLTENRIRQIVGKNFVPGGDGGTRS